MYVNICVSVVRTSVTLYDAVVILPQCHVHDNNYEMIQICSKTKTQAGHNLPPSTPCYVRP